MVVNDQEEKHQQEEGECNTTSNQIDGINVAEAGQPY
jgi:hypothetical protein